MNWHTDPPEWAAYVSSVVAIDRDDALHLAIDMRSKRVECHVEMTEVGKVVVVFYASPSTMGEDGRASIVWPPDLGAWPETPSCPTLIITFDDRGRDLDVVGMQGHGTCPNDACPHRISSRYDVHVTLVPRVNWQDEAAVQEVAGP